MGAVRDIRSGIGIVEAPRRAKHLPLSLLHAVNDGAANANAEGADLAPEHSGSRKRTVGRAVGAGVLKLAAAQTGHSAADIGAAVDRTRQHVTAALNGERSVTLDDLLLLDGPLFAAVYERLPEAREEALRRWKDKRDR